VTGAHALSLLGVPWDAAVQGVGRVWEGAVDAAGCTRASEGVVSQQHRNPGLHGLPGLQQGATRCWWMQWGTV